MIGFTREFVLLWNCSFSELEAKNLSGREDSFNALLCFPCCSLLALPETVIPPRLMGFPLLAKGDKSIANSCHRRAGGYPRPARDIAISTGKDSRLMRVTAFYYLPTSIARLCSVPNDASVRFKISLPLLLLNHLQRVWPKLNVTHQTWYPSEYGHLFGVDKGG